MRSMDEKISSEVRDQIKKALMEHPLTVWQKVSRFLTPLTGAFGLVTLFYGFEALLGESALSLHPWWMVGLGAVLLLLTGSFFSKL